jgi:very-short-patch-repair endonuclease
VKLARKLRKDMSPPERLLWWALKQRPGGYKFRKQCPQGGFVLDFACLEARLAIEVDGESHDRGERPERDRRRDIALKELGFATMRIPAEEVFSNLEGVVLGIVSKCETRGPLHHRPAAGGPPPRSGEER